MKTFIFGALILAWGVASAGAQGSVFVDPEIRRSVAVIQNPSDNGGRLANIATRGLAGPGDNALVAGFVVTEQSRYVLIRAVGPSLSRLGISGFLRRPQISLYNSAGELIVTVGSWTTSLLEIDRSGVAMLAREVGAFPLDVGSDDAVLHRRLTPGAYTVVISSSDAQTGIALVEVYASPTYAVVGGAGS